MIQDYYLFCFPILTRQDPTQNFERIIAQLYVECIEHTQRGTKQLAIYLAHRYRFKDEAEYVLLLLKTQA
jgi:hypothetical protein